MNEIVSNFVQSRYFSFQEYKGKVEKYLFFDNRELNYQNRVIIPLLENLYVNVSEIDVVDVSTQYRNWEKREWHTRSKYAGQYTPDVLVTTNWNLHNKNKTDIEYLLLIKVKTPNANDRKHAMKEIDEYLKFVPNVILTNCITWEFYTESTMNDPCIYCLEEGDAKVCRRGIATSVNWKNPNKSNISNLAEKLEGLYEAKTVIEPVVWTELLDKLRGVINIE